MKKIDQVFATLVSMEKRLNRGIAAQEISKEMNIDRTNISRYLNQLFKQGKVEKAEGRPILYRCIQEIQRSVKERKVSENFGLMVGSEMSLQVPIQQAKAAVLYPPKGLHTLILGETGVGKSMFAEFMYRFALKSKVIQGNGPFITFNCADYAENPQLLITQIFGVKKGAYTGADQDREGLLKKADGGILFLDEVHRLSPQGQEMLFTYIDKGYFRPLGETERTVYVNVRLIAATTEEPRSYLLKTFSRRIPMIIILPPLRKRSISERYALIETFIKEESKRIGKSIYINKNSLISYMLYDCPNNIGQLRSDIQLSCAKAFLSYKSLNINYILINQNDLPTHVRKGLMKIKDYRDEIEHILSSKDDVLEFRQDENVDIDLYKDDEIHNSEDFYNVIERKLESLKEVGMEEEEVNEILNIDIETHFQKYIGNISKKFRKDEILKIVDIDIVEIVEEILMLAQKHFLKEFDEKIYYGLALHLKRSIERIRNGEKIYNPKLNFIRVNYEEEFLFAMRIAKLIDSKFNIEIPIDEIGYLAMFLTTDFHELDDKKQKRAAVILIMHGNSTASSMADVVNNLIGVDHAIALDMPLSMKPEIMYEIVREKVLSIEQERGVILLVDMGSLIGFGDMLHEDTGIEVKTIDMVSTPIALDVCRKAVMGYDIDEIYSSLKGKDHCLEIAPYHQKHMRKNTIITACFTGQGSSIKLKEILQKELADKENIDYIALEMIDRHDFIKNINRLERKYNIISIVSAISIDLEHIPFISPVEVLDGKGIGEIRRIIEEEDMYRKIGRSLKEHMTSADGERVVDDVKILIKSMEKNLGIKVSNDVKPGVALHISFLIDNILNKIDTKKFENLEAYKKQYEQQFKVVKNCMKVIEKKYHIEIGEDETAYILKLFMSNCHIV